ncbi:enoyl-CoA hydratase/isomerase family protein, partial [Escherichia coli]|uniref:enoyl-CoA hydratase/isomerase family protein n=1 Tax=Escherichia coli TaxID=562 RepID=UPI0034D9665A
MKLGLIPGYGGTQRLPRLIGEGRALDMIMLGRAVSAEEAERIGLVHRVANGSAMDAAVLLADDLAAYSHVTLKLAREAVSRAL